MGEPDTSGVHDIGVDFGEGDGPELGEPDKPSRANMALGAVVVVVGVAALAIAFGTPSTDQNTESEPADNTPPPATATARPAVTSAEDLAVRLDGATQAVEDDVQAGSAFEDYSAQVARTFAEQIDSDDVHFGIAYPVAEGVMVLNRNGAKVPAQEVAQNLGIVSTLPLLTTAEVTWAIDPRGDGLAYLVTNNFMVIKSKRLNTLAVYDVANHQVELLAAGQPAPGVELPEGVEVLGVQRRGLLALPRTGGTYEIDGLAQSLRRIDDGRAVAASQQATVFQRCDEQLQCQLVLRVGEDASERVVPLQIGVPISLSPSGAWALQYGGDQNTVMATEDNATYQLAPGEIRGVSWASTGDFVVLLRDELIEIFYPHEQRTLVLDVVVPSSIDALTVYASSVGE